MTVAIIRTLSLCAEMQKQVYDLLALTIHIVTTTE